jgi:anti-sigma-K factor RskA
MSQDPHDLVAPYALDALDDDERARFEEHLAECEECTEVLAQLREPVAALAYAAEGPAPPEALRGRIIEAARSEPRAAVMRFPRRNWALPAAAAVAAVAAVVAVGLGVWATSLSRSLDRERDAKAAYSEALTLLASSNPTVRPLSGAKGSLLVSANGKAAIVVCGLDKAPSDKTYEAWVIRGQTPRSAGLFLGGSGCRPILLGRSVARGSTVAVTLERAGGTTAPTTPILFHAENA